jgi:hypothetical protein
MNIYAKLSLRVRKPTKGCGLLQADYTIGKEVCMTFTGLLVGIAIELATFFGTVNNLSQDDMNKILQDTGEAIARLRYDCSKES